MLKVARIAFCAFVVQIAPLPALMQVRSRKPWSPSRNIGPALQRVSSARPQHRCKDRIAVAMESPYERGAARKRPVRFPVSSYSAQGTSLTHGFQPDPLSRFPQAPRCARAQCA